MEHHSVSRRTVTVDGTKLSYLTSGDHEDAPLVLLHGTFWSRVWAPILPELGGVARCIALDLPGFGVSAGELTPERATIPALAQTVLDAADALDLGSFDVAGHDIGGGIAQHLAATSGRIRRMVLMNAVMFDYTELVTAKTTTRSAVALTGVSRATAARRATTPATPLVREDVPANRLSCAERAAVVQVLNSAEFVDCAPMEVYATLLDRGVYLCSISTMYRILAENAQVKERRRQARHPARAVPELVATSPGQVYTWDITKLAGPVKGTYYDAYVMIDIYSRYIVGAHVHAREPGPLAEEMMRQVFGIHGIPQVVHADRGTSMTSKTVATLLADLQVTRSHSRPQVSNDNPYSEAWFKTLKYGPAFPERFGSLADARAFMDGFVTWYNHEHHHQGLGLHTPANVHYGLATTVAQDRETALAAARAAHPERFATDHTPKILALPEAAWINRPDEHPDQADYEAAA